MALLRFAAVGVLCLGTMGCYALSTGKLPSDYLTLTGNLAYPFELSSFSGGGGGTCCRSELTIEPDGKWTSTARDNFGGNDTQTTKNGLLSKDDLRDLAKVLAKYNLRWLPGYHREVVMLDPHETTVTFGFSEHECPPGLWEAVGLIIERPKQNQ